MPVGLKYLCFASCLAFVACKKPEQSSAEAGPGTKNDPDLTNYDLEITVGAVTPNLPLIALDARVPSVYAAHSFHACATTDGIHLTAWDGAKPLEGHRLWKQYYYLGQDLKNNCTPPETAP